LSDRENSDKKIAGNKGANVIEMNIVCKKTLKRRPPKVITNRGVYEKYTDSNINF